MKEKTFEELIRERIDNFTPSEMVKLMQQVREATIAECRNIASEFSLSDTLKHIDNLPTNSIKIDL